MSRNTIQPRPSFDKMICTIPLKNFFKANTQLIFIGNSRLLFTDISKNFNTKIATTDITKMYLIKVKNYKTTETNGLYFKPYCYSPKLKNHINSIIYFQPHELFYK